MTFEVDSKAFRSWHAHVGDYQQAVGEWVSEYHRLAAADLFCDNAKALDAQHAGLPYD